MPKTSHPKPSKEHNKPLKKTANRISADLAAANRKLRQEIAEHQLADEQLRKLSRAIEQSHMTVVITDLNGNIEYVNPKFVQLTGYSVEEALGQNPRLVKSGETSPEEYKRLWATITVGQAWHGIFHNRKKNGELYWEETNISPVFDANGKITHFVAVKEDITERKQAEQALRESEERIRSILDTTVNGIIITNERGSVESINRAAGSMFGYAENEIIGQNINILMPDPYHTEHDGYIDNYLRTGAKKIIGIGREVTGLRKNGATFPMSLAVSEVLVGSLHLFTGIAQDITERKHAEEKVQQQNQLLSALNQIMLDVLHYRELDKLLQVIVDRSTGLLDAPYSEIMLLEGNELIVRAFTANQSFLAGDRATEDQAVLSWQAVKTRQPAVVEEYAIWQQRRQMHADQHLHAVADFPILSGDRCLGVLGVARDRAGYIFDRAQLQAGSLLAQLTALAIDNVQSYTSALAELDERKRIEIILEQDKEKYRELSESAQRQSRDLALLGEVRAALAREVDLADVLRAVVDAIAKTFGYTQVSVYLRQNDVLHLHYQVGYEQPILEIPMMQGVMAGSLRTGSMIFLEDVHSDPEFIGAMDGITSEICVPLFDQRTAVGALNLESTIGHRLTEADANLMGAIGKQVNDAITRARLYDALRQSEHRYKELVDNAREMIYKTDTNGHFTFVNLTATRLIGYSEAELIGRSYLSLIRRDHRHAAARFYQQQFISKTSSTYFEFPVKTKAGPIIWVGQNVQLMLERASGQILETQCVARDITELKQAQQTLQQQMIELDARNAELDAFGHTVAHDLKSPTSAIIGFSDLLSTDWQSFTDEQRDSALHSLNHSGHKLNAIIDELMLLSGVRQQQVVPEPIEMVGPVEEALRRSAFAIQQSKAEISLPDRSSWPGALGYAPWIEEVWYNYLSNAIKYGGRPPRIKLGASTQLDGTVSFWVQDNGVGLNPQEQSRLFTPFTRLSQVRATGHGLGLSIVQRIIEKLGGEVGVESQPGHGSTFFFTLPIAPRDN